MGLFAQATEVWIEFPDKSRVAIKSCMNAGDQDDLEQATIHAESNGKGEKVILRSARQKLIELNVLKLVDSDGKDYPPTPALLRTLDRDKREIILSRIAELSPLPRKALEKAG